MAIIHCPKDYNSWYILANVGIDPIKETDRYSYDKDSEELTADVAQEQLEQALTQYDHEAWLEELKEINNPVSLEERNRADIDYLSIMTGVDLYV